MARSPRRRSRSRFRSTMPTDNPMVQEEVGALANRQSTIQSDPPSMTSGLLATVHQWQRSRALPPGPHHLASPLHETRWARASRRGQHPRSTRKSEGGQGAKHLDNAQQRADAEVDNWGSFWPASEPSAPEKERLRVNHDIGVVIILVQPESVRQLASLQTTLFTDLPRVLGDRVRPQPAIADASGSIEDWQ